MLNAFQVLSFFAYENAGAPFGNVQPLLACRAHRIEWWRLYALTESLRKTFRILGLRFTFFFLPCIRTASALRGLPHKSAHGMLENGKRTPSAYGRECGRALLR